MIIRNGIRSNLRARGRTALFAGMILVLTLVMVLALGVRLYSDSALGQCDEAYRTIAVVEYMGAEFPSPDEPDPAARAASDAIDDSALRALDGVNAWYRDCHTLSRVEGFTLQGKGSPYRDRGVIAVNHLSPKYATEIIYPEGGFDPEDPDLVWEEAVTDKVEYYTAIIKQSLYSRSGKENIYVSILPDYLPEDVEYNATYVLHGTFVNGDEMGVRNGMAAFLVLPFQPSSREAPVQKLTEGEEAGNTFRQYAEHYRTINNYVHTVTCGDLNDLWEFHQGVMYLREGRMPQGAEECIVSGDIAETIGLSVGDTLELTAFSSAENDRYEILLTDQGQRVTVTGITNEYADYPARIWRQMEPPETKLFGYQIGIAELENSKAANTLVSLEAMMPKNVRVTLLDQGYADAVEPFYSLQSTATNVLLLCAAGTAAVLVLFALLFVGRQSDTVKILVSLGTPSRQIALWLLSGALVISGSASLLGGLLGLLGLPGVFALIQTRMAGEGELLRFSETLVSTVKKVDIAVHTPVRPLVVTVFVIVLTALLLCLLFLGVAYRGGTLRKGKSRVRVPRGKTSTFGAGSLRYALLSIRRGGYRPLLVVAVSAVLTVVILFLSGVFRGWENRLDEALHEMRLEGQVTSTDGRHFSGLTIPIPTARELLALDDVGEMYLSIRSVYWMEEDIPNFGSGAFAQERRADWISAQSQLVAVNNLKGAKEFYFTDPVIQWVDGWEESCLADGTYPTLYGHLLGIEKDKELVPYPAVVGDQFMESHHLSPGSEFSCWVRGGGMLGSELSVPLRIVGVYHQEGTRSHIYLPLSFLIPPDVVFDEAAVGDSYAFQYGSWTEENYRAYIQDYYRLESCRFTLTSAAHLSQTRASLAGAGFGWPGHLGQRRTALILRDASFVKLTENLSRSISIGRLILVLILCVVVLLGFIISWLLISGRKREFAVMRGFGVKRMRLFLSFFWEQALLCTLGCAVGCVAMVRFYAGGALQWLVLAGYVICYLVGCAISVKLIGKMNLMELLSTRE